MPPETPARKEAVRDHLRRIDREADWTTLQGYVYGKRLLGADPFPGAQAFFRQARKAGIEVSIISHKTRTPYRGPAYDLHAAAWEWLASRRFLDPEVTGLSPERVSFSETKEEKLRKIGEWGCTHFIDDLPEILLAEGFPSQVERLHFGQGSGSAEDPLIHLGSWAAVASHFGLPPEEA